MAGTEAPVVYTDGTVLREVVQTAMQAARRTNVPSHARVCMHRCVCFAEGAGTPGVAAAGRDGHRAARGRGVRGVGGGVATMR